MQTVMQGSAGKIIVSKNHCMIIYTIIFTSLIPPNTEFHQTPSSTKQHSPAVPVQFCSSKIISCLLSDIDRHIDIL